MPEMRCDKSWSRAGEERIEGYLAMWRDVIAIYANGRERLVRVCVDEHEADELARILNRGLDLPG